MKQVLTKTLTGEYFEGGYKIVVYDYDTDSRLTTVSQEPETLILATDSFAMREDKTSLGLSSWV